MPTATKLHKELANLGREARKARWSITSTSSGQITWRNPEGEIVAQHPSNLHESSSLMPKIKKKVRDDLDAQYGRDQILVEAAARKKALDLASELARTPVNVPAQSLQERPLPAAFQEPQSAPEPEPQVVVPEPAQEPESLPEPKPVAPSKKKVKPQPVESEIDPSLVIRQGDPGPKFPFRLAMLPVSSLKVLDIHSGGYQRPVDPTWAIKLAMEFSWDDFGRVEVSDRDGVFYVIDGQHRLAALDLTDRLPDESKREVPALIYTGMSLADEADRYLRMNTVRKNTYTLYAWAARMVSDPKAQDIDRIVRECGYVISNAAAPGKGFVSATGRLEMIYDEFGPEGLAQTLALVHDTYGKSETISAVLLGGVSLVLNIYEGVDKDQFRSALLSSTAAQWVARAKFYTTNPGMSDPTSGFKPSTQPVALAQMLVLAYNGKTKKPEKMLGSFDAAYGAYVTAKRVSPRNRYMLQKRRVLLENKPSPGSWLKQSREV